MTHDLSVVDYSLGHLGSVHNAYVFLGTHIVQDMEHLIPEGHWMWAVSTDLRRFGVLCHLRPWEMHHY